MFSSEAEGRLLLRKQSRGPRPLTKGGLLSKVSGEDSLSFSLSETPGSGKTCARGRFGDDLFSFGSGFRRLKGRQAACRKTSRVIENGCYKYAQYR